MSWSRVAAAMARIGGEVIGEAERHHRGERHGREQLQQAPDRLGVVDGVAVAPMSVRTCASLAASASRRIGWVKRSGRCGASTPATASA